MYFKTCPIHKMKEDFILATPLKMRERKLIEKSYLLRQRCIHWQLYKTRNNDEGLPSIFLFLLFFHKASVFSPSQPVQKNIRSNIFI